MHPLEVEQPKFSSKPAPKGDGLACLSGSGSTLLAVLTASSLIGLCVFTVYRLTRQGTEGEDKVDPCGEMLGPGARLISRTWIAALDMKVDDEVTLTYYNNVTRLGYTCGRCLPWNTTTVQCFALKSSSSLDNADEGDELTVLEAQPADCSKGVTNRLHDGKALKLPAMLNTHVGDKAVLHRCGRHLDGTVVANLEAAPSESGWLRLVDGWEVDYNYKKLNPPILMLLGEKPCPGQAGAHCLDIGHNFDGAPWATRRDDNSWELLGMHVAALAARRLHKNGSIEHGEVSAAKVWRSADPIGTIA